MHFAPNRIDLVALDQLNDFLETASRSKSGNAAALFQRRISAGAKKWPMASRQYSSPLRRHLFPKTSARPRSKAAIDSESF